jgi:hypothetical protein
MSLHPTTLDIPVRILGDIAAKPFGSRRGVVGTGFLCAVPSRNLPGYRYGYVVTAHHVIADQNNPEVQAPIPHSKGMALQEPVPVLDWHQPLDRVDLAIADFDGVYGGRYAGLTTTRQFLPPGITPPLGGPIHYVGILDPEDRVMARSGTIGALDQEGIEHPDDYVYTCHLADCRSYGGFSGSPCFAEYAAPVLEQTVWEERFPAPMLARGDTAPRGTIDYYTYLCGMLTWHLVDGRPERSSQYGVVAMLPHYEIWRGLMAFQDDRDKADEKNAAKSTGPKPKNISLGEDADEFERFEELTRKLVHTPKPTGEKPSQ